MKNLSVLTFLLLAASLSSYSQTEWAPIGAKWVNEYGDIMFGEYHYLTFQSVKDTVVLSKICRKIDIYDYLNDVYYHLKDTTYKGYYLMYTDRDRVYYYNKNTFRLLYDFSLQKGDTLYAFQPPKYDTSLSLNTYIIDSINSISISGKQLKRQYLHLINAEHSSYLFRYGEIIERLGFNVYMFGNKLNIQDDYGPYLKCYTDSEISYKFRSSTNCDGFDGINEEDETKVLEIFPNPVNDELVLNYSGTKPFNIEIINCLGIKMLEQNNLSSASNSLNVKSLKPGIYLLVIKNDKTSLVKKFLKQ
jgi:hypothetical protein